MRERVGHGAGGDDDLALRLLDDLEHAVGEGRVAQVGLDAGEHDEVVRAAREAGEAELVERPADVADLVLVELDVRALLREVEERIGVDRGDDRRDRSASSSLIAAVATSAMSNQPRRAITMIGLFSGATPSKSGRQDLGDVQPARAPRRRSRCTP